MKTLSTDTSFKKKQTPHPQMAWTLSTAYLKKQSNFVESNARRLQVRAAAKPVKPKPEPDGEGEAERKERKLCLNELATAETNQAKSETKFLMPQVAPVEERVLRQAMREIQEVSERSKDAPETVTLKLLKLRPNIEIKVETKKEELLSDEKAKTALDFRAPPTEKERILRRLRRKEEKEKAKKELKLRREQEEVARAKLRKFQEIQRKINSVHLPTTIFSLAPDAKEQEEVRKDEERRQELEKAMDQESPQKAKIDKLIRRFSQTDLPEPIVKITEANEDSIGGALHTTDSIQTSTIRLSTSAFSDDPNFQPSSIPLSKPIAGMSHTMKMRSTSSVLLRRKQEMATETSQKVAAAGRVKPWKRGPSRLNLDKAKQKRRLTVILKRGFSLSPKLSGLKDMVEDYSGLPQDISQNYKGMRQPQKRMKKMNVCRKSSRASSESGGALSPHSPLRSDTIFSEISFGAESEEAWEAARKQNFVKMIEQFFSHLQSGQLKQVKQLVKISRMLIYSQDAAGWSAMHHVIRLGNLQFLVDLVHLGAEVDLKDNLGRTPLYLASKLNNFKIVEFLLSSGANPSVKANDRTEAIKMSQDSRIIKALAGAKKTQSTRKELFKSRQWRII